jgi:hypothetical protein
MSQFQLYYQLGLDHILDINGYDHILFVIALSTLYQIEDWRRVLILVTAFTLGHSLTLALATLNIIKVNQNLVEFLIPLTICITGISNLFIKEESRFNRARISINYLFALFFGLIHGMGFSNYLRSLLGRDSTIVTQLFAFNVGLEVGQIIIVAVFLVIGFIAVSIFGATKRDWKLIISSAVTGIALTLLWEAVYW